MTSHTFSTDSFSAPEFFDSHCHFDFAPFDVDRDQVWQACKAFKLETMVVPGVAPEQWPQVADLCAKYPGLYHAAGVHPWWVEQVFGIDLVAAKLDEIREQLRQTLNASGSIAIGECGLDGMIKTPLATQEQVLAMHLSLASELSLPLIIHCHKAHNQMIRMLKAQKLPAGGVIHAFSGSLELAKQYWAMGFYLGIGGTITYERAHKTRAAVSQMPLAALLLESDAPDMPISGRQGQRNSPAYLPDIAQVLADLQGVSVSEVARQTNANARKLFGFPQAIL